MHGMFYVYEGMDEWINVLVWMYEWVFEGMNKWMYEGKNVLMNDNACTFASMKVSMNAWRYGQRKV